MSSTFAPLDFRRYHEQELPEALANGRGALALSDDPGSLGSLAFQTEEGDAYTYRPGPSGVEVVAGADAADTVIELPAALWSEVVHDLESAPGLLYAGRARALRGDAMRFVRWEPALRAMYQGRPIYRPDAVDLRDLRGEPLDPARSFRLGDDREEMAHYLRSAGYLLVKNAFSEDEVESFLDRSRSLEAEAFPGDKRSWYGKNRHGEQVLCRVTRCGKVGDFAALPTDPRITALAELSHLKLVPRPLDDEDGVGVLIKNPDMTEGLSDLPWHRDCGMGGHAAMCPVLIFSIYLEGSRPESGELRMLPGSHESSLGFFEATDPRAPRGIGLAADPGDVSLHYSDIMHAAPPPTSTSGPFRRCVLLSFARPDAYNHRGEQSYNDVLLSRDDGQVEHLAKVARRS